MYGPFCLSTGVRYGLWEPPFLYRSSLFWCLDPAVGRHIFLTFVLEPPLTDIIKCMENLHSRKCLIPFRLQCCFLLKWSSGQRCQGDVLLFAKLTSFSIMHSRTGYRFDQFELMCWFTLHVMAWIINFSTSDSSFKHLWSNGLVILNWISHACLCSVMYDYGFHMQLRLKHPMPLCAAWLRMDVA